MAAGVAGRVVAQAVPGRRVVALRDRAVRAGRVPRAVIAALAALTGAARIEAAVSAGAPTTARTAAARLAR
ncbi:MAG TPA: hypothetical protein VFH60_11555 [Chloroflexia bacterium]|nr:hypothetical protein [Chloroflexia bacterium]